MECTGPVFVTRFGGLFFSGSNSWKGYCLSCRSERHGSWTSPQFKSRFSSVGALKRTFRSEIQEWQEYDGVIFSWGGSGLQPARKKRAVEIVPGDPVSLAVLVAELKSGKIRQGISPLIVAAQSQLHFEWVADLRGRKRGVRMPDEGPYGD